jgi:hypothetical protein
LSQLIEEVGREEGTLQHGDCRAMWNQKKDEEVDVWVITQVEKIWEWTLSMEKARVQRMEGKIRKAVQPPPKFDVAQQKQFLCTCRGGPRGRKSMRRVTTHDTKVTRRGQGP